MDAITRQIEEAIKQHLPQQVGEVLQGQLSQLPHLLKQVEKLTQELEEAQGETVELKAKLYNFDAKLAQHAELDVRKEALDKQERLLTIELLKKDVQCRDQRIADLKEVVMTVFRNPTYQEHHFTSKSVQVPQPGGYSSPMPENESHTITKSVPL